jgi:hypothetical protein
MWNKCKHLIVPVVDFGKLTISTKFKTIIPLKDRERASRSGRSSEFDNPHTNFQIF